jgi:hypothetical protein
MKLVLVFGIGLEKITTTTIFRIGFLFKSNWKINRRYFQKRESVLVLKIGLKKLGSLLILKNSFEFASDTKISEVSAKSPFSRLTRNFSE